MMPTVPVAHRLGRDRPLHPLQQRQFGIEGDVRVGLAGQDKVHLVVQQQLADRLVRVQIIGQDAHAPGCKMPGMLRDPTLDGLLLTVLLFSPILG